MKKFFALFGVLALLGAGCASKTTGEVSTTPPSTQGTTTTSTTPSTEAPKEDVTPQESPAATPPAQPIDDSTWVKTTTRAGVTVTAPVKGSYAPTWTFAVLSADDAHLQGDCYMTLDTASQKTTFTNFEHACQTTTSLSVSAGTRVDYFVIRKDAHIYLLTFTKVYASGFNMNEYAATLDHILNKVN